MLSCPRAGSGEVAASLKASMMATGLEAAPLETTITDEDGEEKEVKIGLKIGLIEAMG